MSHIKAFLPGDVVFYVGQKYKMELTSKDGKPHRGWVHAAVVDNPNAFVVEFPDAKDPDYVMPISVLSKWRPNKAEKQEGPEVQPRRNKKGEEENA